MILTDAASAEAARSDRGALAVPAIHVSPSTPLVLSGSIRGRSRIQRSLLERFLHEAIEAGLRQTVRANRRARAARCGALPAYQKTKLAEVRAGGEGMQELPSYEDVHLAGTDRVEGIGRLALL